MEPRDYVDTAAALERYTVDQLITLAKRLDPGLEDRDFADAGRQLGLRESSLYKIGYFQRSDAHRVHDRGNLTGGAASDDRAR